MTQTLALSPRRMITPVAAFVIALALAATLAVGFGIRTWTEDSARPTAPAVATHASPSAAVHTGNPAPAQPLRKLGKPF
jgi:hypothetical protein